MFLPRLPVTLRSRRDVMKVCVSHEICELFGFATGPPSVPLGSRESKLSSILHKRLVTMNYELYF